MQPEDDSALLRQYVDSRSDEAFTALVTRHVNLVYSVALRQVGHSHNAEEITQAIFIILAKKAVQLRHDKALSSWLFQATRLTANNFIRSEIRRQRREQEACMQSSLNEPGGETWARIAPLLDEAVAALREPDRRAIVLRFYEGRNLREVGLAIGANEAAAEKRVSRALEKLRKFFARHGMALSGAAIAGAISANSVQAAPATLAKSTAAAALTKGTAVSGSTLTLVKGALKIMAWTKTKTAIISTVVVLLFAGGSVPIMLALMKEHVRAEIRATEASVRSRQLVDETHGAILIDLKPFINTKLTDSPSSPKNNTANNLAELPLGNNLYAGVPFDVEGTIQLMGNKFKSYGKHYPVQVEKIPLGQSCTKLHLLHGESTIPWEQSGMSVAKLVVHYSSGVDEEFNLVAGQQAFDFWGPTHSYGLRGKPEIKPAPGTELAWTGTIWVQQWLPQFRIRLYRTTFINPRPTEVISSVDYVSTMAQDTAPFLVALTVE